MCSLLIVTNASELSLRPASTRQSLVALHGDLQTWLLRAASDNLDADLLQLREQLCAGFFLLFAGKTVGHKETIALLERVKSHLPADYYDGLLRELTGRSGTDSTDSAPLRPRSHWLQQQTLRFWLLLETLASRILDLMRVKYAVIVAVIRKHPTAFAAFCRSLFRALLLRLQTLTGL